MLYLNYLPEIAPLLLLALLVVSLLFAFDRKDIAPGWRRLPATRHEWTVLWFHTLESLLFCSVLAVTGRAGDVASALMFASAALLFVSAFAPVPLPLRVHAGIVLLLFVLGFLLMPVVIVN